MRKLRRRGSAAALIGTVTAGIMIASTGPAFAGAWTDTPYFYIQYDNCARDGKYVVAHGLALNWDCVHVKWWDSTYRWQLREFVE